MASGTGRGERALAREVSAAMAVLVGLVAVVAGALGGRAEGLGALVGGALLLAHFHCLGWTARAAVRAVGGASPWRRLLWIGASGARFGLLGLLLGLAVTRGGLGLGGLLAVLATLPVAVVIAGLRSARTA